MQAAGSALGHHTETAYSQNPPVRQAVQVLAEQWLRLSGPPIIPKEERAIKEGPEHPSGVMDSLNF